MLAGGGVNPYSTNQDLNEHCATEGGTEESKGPSRTGHISGKGRGWDPDRERHEERRLHESLQQRESANANVARV